VTERSLWATDPAEQAQQIFDAEIDRCVQGLGSSMADRWGTEPRRWSGFALKRARLAKVASRLADLLRDIPRDAALPEVEYSVFEARLRGRADLVVDAPGLHAVADYKTGRVIDEQQETIPAYIRQVTFYCAMEEERSGRFPERAWLVPFDGPLVDVDVTVEDSRALVERALDAMTSFNEVAPAPQPPRVSIENCPTCPYAPKCPAFWEEPSEGLPDGTGAVEGAVEKVQRSEAGGISITVEAVGGTFAEGDRILVRNLSSSEWPAVETVQVGMVASIVGLHAEAERASFRVSRSGHLHIWGSSPWSDGDRLIQVSETRLPRA
jgi:hypothetical protein